MINSNRAVRRQKARESVEVFENVKTLSLQFLDRAKGESNKNILFLFEDYQREWESLRQRKNKLGNPIYLKRDGLKNYVIGMEGHLHHVPGEMQGEYIRVIRTVSGGKLANLVRKIKKYIYEKA